MSFLWVSSTYEKHSLISQPQLSACLVLLISGILSFLASLFPSWLPGANGRFDEESQPIKAPSLSLPKRPRRFFLPGVILCIVLRIELYGSIARDLQCSTPGVESFLCTILVVYSLISGRNPKAIHTELDSVGNDAFEDFKDWLSGSKAAQVAAALTLGCGTCLSLGQSLKSTYFCSPLEDSYSWTFFLQLLGLVLDSIIATLLWRIIAWAKTTRARLRTLSPILLLSSFGIFMLWAGHRLYAPWGVPGTVWRTVSGTGTLYIFDLAIDSCAICALIVSAIIFSCEAGPLAPVGIFTLLVGFLASWQNMLRIGTWQQTSRSGVIVPVYLICLGFVLFLYTSEIRSVVFIRRAFFAVLLLSAVIGTTTYATLLPTTVHRHPLVDLIYDTRIQAHRWLLYASVSGSLHVAVQEYKERHNGRDPPPNFDKWYDFAKQRNSAIMDHFQQIEDDLLPFWGMSPESVREQIGLVEQEPHICMVTIENGEVSHAEISDPEKQKPLQDLVKMIESFVQYLPDMSLPINLEDGPRVLAPYHNVQHLAKSGSRKALNILPRLTLSDELKTDGFHASPSDKQDKRSRSPGRGLTSSRDLPKMIALACPPGSPGRSPLYWDVRNFCSSCVSEQSLGHFLTDWELSLDECLQPDLINLNGFHLRHPQSIQTLVPVFSRSKLNNFNDILIPLTHPADDTPDSARDFQYRHDKLFWRGDSDDSFAGRSIHRGSQKNRLLHLVNNSTSSDVVTMLLPKPSTKNMFEHDFVPARQASAVLPIDVGISHVPDCAKSDCTGVKEFGWKPDAPALDNRYVLLLDSNSGPAPSTLNVLRSSSAPFIASVFRTWYTERLTAWAHFVPIDVRFHALHSTAAYFLGLKGRGKLNGREIDFKGRPEDGKWIANESKAWAKKALRREDMEIYLFRLLLEWGRVIDDERDDIGFQL